MSKVKSNQKSVPVRPRYDYFRIAICAALVSAVMIIMFSLNNDQFADLISKIKEKKDSPNLLWLVQHITAAIPTLAATITMCIVYRDKRRYVPIYTQKEKMYISLILVAVTVMMFIYVAVSDGKVDAKDGVQTLLEKTATWFAAQIIPLTVLVSYHAIRSGSEARELEEAEAKK